MSARIRLVALASESLRAYPLVKKQTTVGSAPDNDVVLDHKSVSRRHAVIVRRFGRFGVRDLQSTNGTRINGRRTANAGRVRPGDELEFGSVRFAVMNSPRRGPALGAWTTIAILFFVMVAGFSVARYLHFYPLTAPPAPARSPSAPSASAPSGSAPSGSAPPATEHPVAPVAAPAPAPVSEGEGAPGATSKDKTAVVVPSVPSGDETEWLRILNNYRAMAGLAAEREDPALSNGAFAHARYLVKNGGSLRDAMAQGAEIHNEERGKPYYSAEGLRAARSGDIEQWWGPLPTSMPPPGWAIDQWVASTWHRLAILNPRLHDVGYGEFCERGQCAAVLDVLSGLGTGALTRAGAPAPIEFPPEGAAVHINALGGEWPNPLSSCYGYTLPAGLPITMQVGVMVPARLSAYSLRRESASQILEACAFDALSYSNPSGPDQERGREALTDSGAVVVVPREPLAPGNYTVEMTVNGRSYTWRFSVQKDAG